MQLAMVVAALAATFAGVMALSLTATLAQPLGLRPALLLAELALATPALIVAALFRPTGDAALLGPGRPSGKALAACLGAGISLWLLSLGVMNLQALVWPPPPGLLDAFRALHTLLRPNTVGEALLSVAAIACAPALCEELVFRGLVLPSLAAWRGPAVGLVVSSLLFGAIHLDYAAGGVSAYRVPFAIVVGFGFGLLRLRTRTLLAPMLAHAMLNALTFAAVPLVDLPTGPEPSPNPWLALAFVVIGSLSSAWLWRVMGPARDAAA